MWKKLETEVKRNLFLAVILLLIPTLGVGQNMKVKWEDDDGREFAIKVISGDFGYSMVPGDDIKYDILTDKVKLIGDVVVEYDLFTGKVKRVGDVTIQYNIFDDNIKQVGGLTINYNYLGKVKGTRGQVR